MATLEVELHNLVASLNTAIRKGDAAAAHKWSMQIAALTAPKATTSAAAPGATFTPAREMPAGSTITNLLSLAQRSAASQHLQALFAKASPNATGGAVLSYQAQYDLLTPEQRVWATDLGYWGDPNAPALSGLDWSSFTLVQQANLTLPDDGSTPVADREKIRVIEWVNGAIAKSVDFAGGDAAGAAAQVAAFEAEVFVA